MILRIIYLVWKYFWRTVFTLAGVAIALVLLTIGILQLPPGKEYIKNEIQTTFNNQFEGTLEINRLTGFLPFTAGLDSVSVYSPADSADPVLSFENAAIDVSWWELLQKNLVVSSLEISSPSLRVGYVEEDIGLSAAFRQKERINDSEPGEVRPRLLERMNIFAPHISVSDGSIRVDPSVELPGNFNLPSPLRIEDLSFTIFLDLSESQIFFDLPDFMAHIPGSPYGNLRLSGQFYNDAQYFELNRFRIGTDIGSVDFSFEASPASLFQENFQDQLRRATYRFQITESSFSPELIRQFAENYPDLQENLEIEMISEGTLEEYYIDRLQANIGQSSVLISAEANDLLESSLSYNAYLDNMVIHPDKFEWFSETYLDGRYNLDRYQLSTIRGELMGTRSALATDFRAETQAGSFYLNGNLAFENLLRYDLTFEVDSLDITPFLSDTTSNSIIRGLVTLDGEGTGEQARFTSSVDLSRSSLYGYEVDSFIADFAMENRHLDYDVRGRDGEFFLSASGRYADTDERKSFVTEGEVRNFDLKKYYRDFHADTTRFNSTFSTNLEWTTGREDLTGRASFQMDESVIDGDTLRPHQFYADLQQTDTNSRRMRFTSSFFDGEIEGTLYPEHIKHVTEYWAFYLKQQAGEEFLFNPAYFEPEENSPAVPDTMTIDLDIEMTVKDLSLFRKYVPRLPDLESNARFTASAQAGPERLLITGNLIDPDFLYGDFAAQNFNAAFTASLRHESLLKESSTIDLQISSEQTVLDGMELKEVYLNISMRNDSLHIENRLERLHDDLALESVLTGYLRPDKFEIIVNNLNIGTSRYNWTTEGQPVVSYTERQALEIEEVILTSDEDYLEINGTYSADFQDSVEYTIRNFDLSRVSELIGGRIRFSGILNGDFITQTLTRIPSVQGNIDIEQVRIQDRVIGDVTLNSSYQSDSGRFDTEIHVFTDPEKYNRYYRQNDQTGQNLILNGYFKLPDETDSPDEDLYYFDADLREIDMWIVTVIVPNIITDMEGSATGTGYIRGTRDDFDFGARFHIEDVYGKPAFTNVDYTLNGDLEFNKTDGLLFHDIELRDRRNRTGTLRGQVDLDNFSPTTYLDLTLDLNNLEFMNNPHDPDIPFYGSISGTGQARITGTNFNPVLRTTRPLVLSSDSRISIPLEPEVEFEQDHRFIRFVDSFDTPVWERTFTRTSEENGGNGNEGPDLSFMEMFTMDLQFQANNPVNVRLIFDPVTNDILSANGTGQIRILLEDQDVSMFGRFNITSGEYQFVSGDIFTRRFALQEGGSITWSGDLVDASLNVTAIYRARPNISTLMSVSGSATPADPGQRIPIELVLQIGGTITEVENDFFFRVPTGIEGTVDPTIATQINNLNQNEDEKLIQATSILLSGNFIPSSQAQGLGLAEGLSGTAVVVNPLITSQVINPLLSNQINSLLRSDITFDIDINLTTFNELDLGVALRLFDDRVILRREGQITGEQSDIGDIGATYRINRIFSITAFHRQDPTLAYTSGGESRQAQEMNGVGVEARFQFNTWQKLRARFADAFRSLFGLKKDDEAGNEPEESVADQIK